MGALVAGGALGSTFFSAGGGGTLGAGTGGKAFGAPGFGAILGSMLMAGVVTAVPCGVSVAVGGAGIVTGTVVVPPRLLLSLIG